MITRKMLIVAVVLIVLIAGTTMPSIAESQNDNNGQTKNAGDASNQFNQSTDRNSKSITTMPVPTHQPEKRVNLNNGSATVQPTSPRGNGTNTSEVTDKITIGNLQRPALGINKTSPAVFNKTPLDNIRLKAEKKQANRKINVAVNQLNIYKRWVNNSRLSESDKVILIGEANNNIEWYGQMDREIQAATSLVEVQGIMADVEKQTTALKTDLKMAAGTLACDKEDTKITTARNVSNLVEQRIATLKSNDNDTTKLDQLLSDYDTHVAAAATYTEAARADFKSITSADSSDKLFSGGYRNLQQAEVELSLAYNDLKEIYRILLRAR